MLRQNIFRRLGLPMQYLDSAALKKYIGLVGAHGAVLDPNAGQINGLTIGAWIAACTHRTGC